MAKSTNLVGKQISIAAGTRVYREGKTAIQKRASKVTVRAQQTTSAGKTRILWNSMGYKASTLI